MGREIKRVAMDFDWPQGEVWEGYLNPHYKRCSECGGNGSTPDLDWFNHIVDLLMSLGESGASGTSGWRWRWSLDPLAPRKPPTSKLAQLTEGLAGRPMGSLGHDGLDAPNARRKILEAAELDEEWGFCPRCQGEGEDPSAKAASDAWEKTEPPAGEGWQMWETVSEGSPVSPVFATADELVSWLVNEKGYARHAASAFVAHGWAPSMVMTIAGDSRLLQDGIEAAGNMVDTPSSP